MIISRTPLRVSLAGGGTDIQDYYKNGHGSVLSTAIRKHMYVTVNRRFEDDIRVSYSKTEIVDSLSKLEHGIVRECLKKVGIASNIEVTTIADIPSRGTGLGSFSALTVGLLNALYAFTGHRASPKRLAEEACEIEIDLLKEPGEGGCRHRDKRLGQLEECSEGGRVREQGGAVTIGLTGFDGGKLAEVASISYVVPVKCMQQIEDIHLLIEHMLSMTLRDSHECGM